jgi:uncharacterized membrane protein YhaH (DUF805 family)
MNFGQAIASGFNNYVNFTDRAVRSAFWFWMLFYWLVLVVGRLIDFALFYRATVPPIYMLAWLALLLPTLAVAIRRLHDTNRSGWWILIGLIPLVGWIILIVWYCEAGTPGANRFGPDPQGRTA